MSADHIFWIIYYYLSPLGDLDAAANANVNPIFSSFLVKQQEIWSFRRMPFCTLKT